MEVYANDHPPSDQAPNLAQEDYLIPTPTSKHLLAPEGLVSKDQGDSEEELYEQMSPSPLIKRTGASETTSKNTEGAMSPPEKISLHCVDKDAEKQTESTPRDQETSLLLKRAPSRGVWSTTTVARRAFVALVVCNILLVLITCVIVPVVLTTYRPSGDSETSRLLQELQDLKVILTHVCEKFNCVEVNQTIYNATVES